MKTLLLLFALASLTFFGGCASRPNLPFYYGAYSRSLYHYKRAENPESLEKHLAVLQQIFKESEAKHLKVGPGLYAEYGYYMLQKGDRASAVEYFRKEEALYPESVQFLEFIQNPKTAENK